MYMFSNDAIVSVPAECLLLAMRVWGSNTLLVCLRVRVYAFTSAGVCVDNFILYTATAYQEI